MISQSLYNTDISQYMFDNVVNITSMTNTYILMNHSLLFTYTVKKINPYIVYVYNINL